MVLGLQCQLACTAYLARTLRGCLPPPTSVTARTHAHTRMHGISHSLPPAIISDFCPKHPQRVVWVSQHSHIISLRGAQQVVAQQLVLVGVCSAHQGRGGGWVGCSKYDVANGGEGGVIAWHAV